MNRNSLANPERASWSPLRPMRGTGGAYCSFVSGSSFQHIQATAGDPPKEGGAVSLVCVQSALRPLEREYRHS